MDITTPEQAHEAVGNAVARATERYVQALKGDTDPIRFSSILGKPVPPMVDRVLRSVEESFWRREAERRQRDPRFQYNDPALREVQDPWDAQLRKAMVLTVKELRQLIGRALTLQMEAILSPVECLKANYFSREEKITARNAVIIASHLGLEERYVRALTLMAQDSESRDLAVEDLRRIIRDVDAKEHGGSEDRAALSSLRQALLVLGLRKEDEFGEAPVDLALGFLLLRGTSEGLEKVRETCKEQTRVDMLDLDGLFVSGQPSAEGPARSTEEVQRFLEEIGVDEEIVSAQGAPGGAGGVRFMLTDEEKQAYVARAVGRNVHLIDPIMKAIEGALTWEEVDRVINDMIPDDLREADLTPRGFRSRIR